MDDKERSSEVKVSVIIITYGHEKYIEEALDSVLMQKTEFNYEIIIGEDKSPDNTLEILHGYREMYPNKIRIISNIENLGASRNYYNCLRSSKGQYVTLLEGDDYWIDESKLQTQVSFLETNEEYVGVSHVVNCVNDSGGFVEGYNWDKILGDISVHEYLDGKTYSNSACMFRNDFELDELDIIYKAHKMIGEHTIGMLLLDKGNIFTLPLSMSVYRKRMDTTLLNYSSLRKGPLHYKDRITVFNNLEKYFNGKYSFRKRKVLFSYIYFIQSIKKGWFIDYLKVFKEINISTKFLFVCLLPLKLMRTSINSIYRKLKNLFNKRVVFSKSKTV